MNPYYYIRNGQGDVIGLFDANGTIVARYTYDSWGNLLQITDDSGNDKTNDTTFVGYKNPLRYRGYYYDSETKLYYLQSRYYNPEWGRFINVDGIITSNLVGSNLFTYCYNNPVMFSDPSGHNAEPYYVDYVWYDIYGHGRMDNPQHPDFVYDRDPYFKEQSMRLGGAERGTPRTVRSPDERLSTRYTKEDYVVENFIPNTVYNFCQDPFFDSGAGLVIKNTVVSGIVGGVTGATGGALSGAFGAPFTAGASIPACAIFGGITGFVTGGIGGFATTVLTFLFD